MSAEESSDAERTQNGSSANTSNDEVTVDGATSATVTASAELHEASASSSQQNVDVAPPPSVCLTSVHRGENTVTIQLKPFEPTDGHRHSELDGTTTKPNTRQQFISDTALVVDGSHRHHTSSNHSSSPLSAPVSMESQMPARGTHLVRSATTVAAPSHSPSPSATSSPSTHLYRSSSSRMSAYASPSSTSSHPHIHSSISFPPLTWVCHSNRSLVHACMSMNTGAKSQTHRGILDPPTPNLIQMMENWIARHTTGSSTAMRGVTPSSISSNPIPIPPITPLSFHISLYGAMGSGKSSVVHQLTGRPLPTKHVETSGISIMDIAWPYKSFGDDLYALNFSFWDFGWTSSIQFKYMQTTPITHAHLCIYVVSATDKDGWMIVQKKVPLITHTHSRICATSTSLSTSCCT